MNLAPSELQNSIAASVSEFLRDSVATGGGPQPGGGDERDLVVPNDVTWKSYAQLGWVGMTVSEAYGGVGLGLAEEVMLFREIGRYLASGPFLGSALGARVAAVGGEKELAGRICSGRCRVGLLVRSSGVDVRDGDLALRISPGGASLVKPHVKAQRESIDPGVAVAEVEGSDELLRVQDKMLIVRARVLLAAQCLGIIEAVRDRSAEYARTRVQFGRPIGAFQAVKHRCADMAIAAASTVGQIYQAALYVDAGHPDAAFHAAAAYVLAARAANRCAADNVQNHGAIGFTWEHDAHLYVKRALVLENMLGPLADSFTDILAPARHEFR